MSRVVLFGTGRGADVAHRFLARDSYHDVCGFALDRQYIKSTTFHDLPVVAFEDIEARFPPDEFKMFVLLGYQRMNGLRADKYAEAKKKGYSCISYVNSHFYRAEDLNIGENCFILDNQSISLDVKIGNNVVMWSSNHIGDLSVVDDHTWLASHCTIAANVTIGARSFIGVGATIGNNITLGERTFVGANGLITTDTAPGSVHATPEADGIDLDSTAFVRIMMAKGKL
jgi:sugar O-acyltransferase (sialic acid O-acetyltransferase NeuD family)